MKFDLKTVLIMAAVSLAVVIVYTRYTANNSVPAPVPGGNGDGGNGEEGN